MPRTTEKPFVLISKARNGEIFYLQKSNSAQGWGTSLESARRFGLTEMRNFTKKYLPSFLTPTEWERFDDENRRVRYKGA